MTFDDDFCRIQHPTAGTVCVPLRRLGLDWPPPEKLCFAVANSAPMFVRVSMSEITDDERAALTHVCRGADYVMERH